MIDLLFRKLEHQGPVSDEERRFLEQAPWRVVEYHNEAIVREGNSPTDSCLVLEGFAYRFKSLPQGTRAILAFHIPGDFVDLHGFLLRQMDHGIAASGRCKIGKLPHTALDEITQRFPRLTRSLWWDTAMDAAVHREWMVSMGRRDAREQIAHLFCELLLRFRSVGLTDGDSYPLPCTQAELGDAFGLSTVHVNRTLQKLREEGLITLQGRRVVILDPERLMAVAGFDPAYLRANGSSG